MTRSAVLLSLALLGPAACGDEVSATCSDALCDDGNPCTEDRCDAASGRCRFTDRDDGFACGDGDACNGAQACVAGACTVTMGAPVIDDGQICTEDRCDPATGEVSHDRIDGCVIEALDWSALPSTDAPTARTRHSALWTGSEMIVWGGELASGAPTASGARYDPAADAWTPTSTAGAPAPRSLHSAVWTGTRMLVWGGFGDSDFLTDGGIYDPATDTWTPITSAGAPDGRSRQTAVWTGAELVVWGGTRGGVALGDGARYDPTQDSWTPLPSVDAPSPRFRHEAAWLGGAMVVWAGQDIADWLTTGASYDPGADTWAPMPTDGAPPGRQDASSTVVDGSLFAWGGWDGGNYLASGGLFGGAAWQPVTPVAAPTPRANALALWSGEAVLIWGGCSEQTCALHYADGGLWWPGPAGGTWTPVSDEGAPPARIEHQGVWTGEQYVIWGGTDGDQVFGDGARAAPSPPP